MARSWVGRGGRGAALGALGALGACNVVLDTSDLASAPSGASLQDASAEDAHDAGETCAVGCGPSGLCVASVCVPKSGLVAWYSFEESLDVVRDLSGNENHGKGLAGTITPGKVGPALELASDGCVLVPDSPSLKMDGAQALTMMAWVRAAVCTAGSPGRGIVLNKENTYEMGVACPAPSLQEAIQTGSWSWEGDAALEPGTWQHVAVTWDGSLVRHYVDGAEVYGRALTGRMPGQSTGLGIGCRDVGADGSPSTTREWFRGAVDEVALYSRALSAAEVRAYYEATR